jgi:transposase
MYFSGIDWADDHHDVCIIDEAGNVIVRFNIPHNRAGLDTLFEHVSNVTHLPEQIPFALETDKGLLVCALLDAGYTVYSINPKAVDRYRDRYSVAGSKSDAFDAEVLANILRTDRHRFSSILPDSERAQELKMLTRDHQELVRQRTRLTNQLMACLKAYYPVALDLFSKISCPTALDFLETFPSSEKARGLNLEDLKAFLKTHRYPGVNQKADELYALLRKPELTARALVIEAKRMLMLSLVAQLKALIPHIHAFEQRIKKLFNAHTDKDIFTSLPGAADNLAPRILAELGDNQERYKDYSQVQAEAGTVPVTRASGKSHHVSFRYGCKKPFRATMQQLAFCSLKQCDWARSYYDQLRKRGKSHQHALRALANIWVKIVYTMWRKHAVYNENLFLTSREAHS